MFVGFEEELEQPGDQPVEPEREDAGKDLETRYIFSQWPQLLLAYYHQVSYQFSHMRYFHLIHIFNFLNELNS